MYRVMGWLFAGLALMEAAMVVARMLDGGDATADLACMIACSAVAGVCSMREEIDR